MPLTDNGILKYSDHVMTGCIDVFKGDVSDPEFILVFVLDTISFFHG
jgi:hypothetical protein